MLVNKNKGEPNMNFVVEQPDLQDAIIVNAAEFGVSEASLDNTVALNKAIMYCKKYQASVLEVAKGYYRFDNTETINLQDMHNFCLNGNESEFIFSNLGYFRLNNCDHVLLKDITVDWDWDKERLASLARVINISEDYEYIDFEFPELESVDTNLCFYSMNQYDNVTLSPGTENGQEFWIEKLASVKVEKGENANQLRVFPAKGSFPNLSVEDLFLVRHTPRRGVAFKACDCSNLTYLRVNIYSSPGNCFMISGETHHFKLDTCKICLRPNSNRRMSSDADGLHIVQSKGYIIVENCDFSFMGDDAVNIHDCMGFVLKRIDDYNLQLENTSVGNVGDIFEIRRPDFSKTGDVLELLKINDENNGSQLTFSNKIPSYIGETYMVVNTRFNSSNYIIRNNYFHHNRARGLLLQCSNGLVEGNKFSCIQGAAIYVMMETLRNFWYEGIGVDNLMICNNVFENCNVNDWSSIIDIMAVIPDKKSEYPIFTNITIENNLFDEFPSGVIFINKSRDIKIKSNTFKSNMNRITNKNNRGHFYIYNSSDIIIENNIWKSSPYIISPGFINTDPKGDGGLYRTSCDKLF